MHLISILVTFQIFSENWKYLRSEVKPEFGETCNNDKICKTIKTWNQHQESEFQCSICVEDAAGKSRCLETFIQKGWFGNQCKITNKCDLDCFKGGECEYRDKQYIQTCFCTDGNFGTNCKVSGRGFVGLRMLQWRRENIFAKPGEKSRFYYRSVGNTDVITNGLSRVFKTDLGYFNNAGEDGKYGTSEPTSCMDKRGVSCTEDYVDLRFPFLLPGNDRGVTVLKMKDKLKGYLAQIQAKFTVEGMGAYVDYKYDVFVNYESVPFLKCIPVIQLTNCAKSPSDSSKFTFHRNEPILIDYYVKFLRDGAYLSTATKANRQVCSSKDVTWIWTWSKYFIRYGIETQGEEGTEIGTYFKFKPFSLDQNSIYRVNLRIKRVASASTNENYDECYFKVKGLPLKAKIDGGEVRTIIRDTGVSLSAKQSYDPNEPADSQGSLAVKWSCECLTKNIPNCEKTCKKKFRWLPVVQEFFVPPSDLQYSAEYKFTAQINSHIKYDKTIAPQFSHVIIKVANQSVKVVTNYNIRCIQNCHQEVTLSNEILFLKAEMSVSGKSAHKINDSLKFDWVYSKENDPALQSVDSIKLADLPTSMLAIKENSFENGVAYTIWLKEHGIVVAEYSFKTKSINYEGNCTVEPRSGVKGLSNFNIICVGVEGFIFEYFDMNEEDMAEKAVFNGRMLGTSEFLGVLKDVTITRGNIKVYIIHKDCKLFIEKHLKVELSPWNVTDEIMDEIKKNLTSTVRLDNMPTTMNYISFIPDILPDGVDKGEILELLLEPISKVTLNTVSDVKLCVSTLKMVLQSLNKPRTNILSLGLIENILLIIKSQANIVKNAVRYRETFQWMSTMETKLLATALLECLNSIINSEDAYIASLTEKYMHFDTLFILRGNARNIGEILDMIKDILSYLQPPGLPPARLACKDESFQIWAMGNDEQYPVTEMLKKSHSIPFSVSQHLLKIYSEENKAELDLYFQAALIDKNVFSWSKSDVRSKLVSLSVAFGKKSEDFKKIKLLSSPILVKISMEKNMTNTTVKGSALQLDHEHLDITDLDLRLRVHKIYNPPKGFITIRFLFPPTVDSLRVRVMEDFRPDYELMTNSSGTIIINSSHPQYPLPHRSIDLPMFLYMGILPAENVAVNKSVDYEFEVTQNLCQLWVEGQWSSIGCTASEVTTYEEMVCECNHLSIFAAAFPVPPQSIDPFADAKLFLTVLDNPVVVVFVIALFIVYLLLVLWGRYKDKIDRFKGKVVVLDDNYPEDSYPYLVAVHTSARFNAGTTAHVGIKIMGKKAKSRAHVLSSERRKVLTRNSDDWFMIYTPLPLGDIYGVHVWHDNYGSRPEWYCDKIVVYDLTEHTESIFIVEQWLALRLGDFPEANLVIASNTDFLNIKRMFLDNSILGFRDSHTFLSIFVRHPRSEVTRVQRISILMLAIMVAMLCSIMFYIPDNDDDSPSDDFQYSVGVRELIVSIQTLIITAALTLVSLIAFKRSNRVAGDHSGEYSSTLKFRRDEIADLESKSTIYLVPKSPDSSAEEKDKSFYQSYVQYVSKFFKGPPLAPVYIWESEEKDKKRLIFWYIIAWLSCISIITVSAYFVMLYGLKLGLVHSQKWLTSLVMTMGEDLFLMGPGRIIFIAMLLSMAFQVSTRVNLHKITVKDAMQARPKNELTYLNILLAKRCHPMYAPLSSSARSVLLKKKEIRAKWWNLIDFINAVCFVVVISEVIYRLWTSHFHGVSHLKETFVVSQKKQFGSPDIKDIRNISMVERYLEIVLIEAVFNRWWYNQELLTIGEEQEGIVKYWIEDHINKPISKPLLRQIRVVPYDCSNVYFKNMSKCLLKWSLENKDENVYGESWVPAMYLDTTKKDSPWEYTDRTSFLWWTNLRFYGVYGRLYDVSGYDTFIGPTMEEAQKMLAELRQSKWQDWFTRACFTTFTVYNVNEHTFSQITILFEYFVDGSMASNVVVIPVSRTILVGVWELLFCLYAVYYIFRSGYLINRMGLMDYLKSMRNVTRVINVLLSFVSICIWCFHHHTSTQYSESYMKHTEDKYFDFDSFISIFSLLQIVLSLLLCVAIARAFMLLKGGRGFLNIYYALKMSITLILWLAIVFNILVFVCKRLQYFLNCEEYFRTKELTLPKKFTLFVTVPDLENYNIQVFILLRLLAVSIIHALFIILFCYYSRIAKVYKPRESDSFNFVLFFKERVIKFSRQKRSIY